MDNDYNRKLANNLSQINYALAKRDTLTDTIGKKAGSVSKQRTTENKNMYVQDLASVGNKYIMSGSSATYPMFNMSEMQRLDREKSNPLYYQRLHNSQLKGGISWNDVGNFFKPIGSAVLDVAAPVVGSYLGGPMGATAATAIRKGIKGATGVGLKRGRKAGAKSAGAKSAGAKSAGVGTYREQKVPKEPKAPKEPKEGGRRKSSGKVNKRAEIVKSVMKDMGLKMTDASKYVKEKGLYKK